MQSEGSDLAEVTPRKASSIFFFDVEILMPADLPVGRRRFVKDDAPEDSLERKVREAECGTCH